MEPLSDFSRMLNEFGVASILAALLFFLWWTVRVMYRVLLDPDSGLLIVAHREMIASIKSNSESNAINAVANQSHAKAHDRCSKALQTLARRFPEIHDDDSDHQLEGQR